MTGFRSAHFRWKHRLVAFVSVRLFRSFTYTIRHGLAAGMRRKGGLGFLPFGEKETAETRFLRRLNLSGKTVYDIGGFEGLLTLFFAGRARTVVTYEPNPRNFRRCSENIALNGLQNVLLFNRGISDRSQEIELVCDPLMPGASTGAREVAAQIRGSVGSAATMQVPVAALDEDVKRYNLPAPDLIKLDIEGMELDALRGMAGTIQSHSPDLYIELHGAELADKWSNAMGVLELLETWGYRVFDVEAGRNVDAHALQGAMPPGHLYCTKRMEEEEDLAERPDENRATAT